MKIRIVAVTQPRVEGINTPEEFIVYAARVSNPDNQMNTETGGKLLKYCYDKKHFSIFEMVNIVMEIETTRDIGRQILRHGFRFQEFSQRYSDPTESLDFETREARLHDPKNRQNSIEPGLDDVDLEDWWNTTQRHVAECTNAAYKEALKLGIAKEQARAVLPEGLMKTRMYANGTLRQWIHYIAVRTDPSTQKEHRQIALDIAHQICLVAPSLENIIEKMLHEHER